MERVDSNGLPFPELLIGGALREGRTFLHYHCDNPEIQGDTVHLFGIRYADEIRAFGSKVEKIVLEAELPATHAGEIRKAMRIAGHVTLGRDTRRKAPARSPLSGTVLAPAPDE